MTKRSSRSTPTGPGSRGGTSHIRELRNARKREWVAAHPEYQERHNEQRRERRHELRLARDGDYGEGYGIHDRVPPRGRMLTSREVAEYMQVHVNTVKRLGDLDHLRYYVVSTRGDRRYRMVDVWACIRRLRSSGGRPVALSGPAGSQATPASRPLSETP